MLVILFLLVVTFLLLIYIKFKSAYDSFKDTNVPHLPPKFPFGNMATVILRKQCMGDRIIEIYQELKSQGAKFAGLYFFSRKTYLMIDPKLIKSVLLSDFQNFNDRGIFYDEVNDPISAHLFSLSGQKWKSLRTKLTPAFTLGKIKYMFNSIEICAQELIKCIENEVSDDILNNANNSRIVEVKDLLARYTTDVIGSCAFGIECNSLKHPQAIFREMGKRAFTQTKWDAFKMIVMRSYPNLAKFLRFSVFPPSVTQFFRYAVLDTINYREKRHVKRPDFLQLLIQLKNYGNYATDKNDNDNGNEIPHNNKNDNADNVITMDEIVAQAFIFFLAGFETTSTAMSFALLELSSNEEVQEKAREEIRRVIKNYQNEICYESINDMHYLDWIISESLRKFTPAPVYLRKCTENYRIPDTDVVIEKGLSVLIPALALHRDSDYFPDPLKFDPERFNESNKAKIKDFTYIPFGEGPRVCIGKKFAMVQAKLALSVILKNYKLSLCEEKSQLEIITTGIIYTTKGGIWLKFEKIQQC